ncbi:MAG TPA: helix-turn-helix transcriptional regulator [Streptosporangiaceae bacterium]
MHHYSLGPEADIAPVAALMADATRATMLTALLDDRPLAAGELARLAGVSPATASAHLARLLQGSLITVLNQGRHRYYRLAGPGVAAALEALSHISPPMPVRSLRASRQEAALAAARTCYDHLAGRAGVSLLDALRARGVLAPGEERPTVLKVTEQGEGALAAFGINVETLRNSRPACGRVPGLDRTPVSPERGAGRGDHGPAARPWLDRARRAPAGGADHPGRRAGTGRDLRLGSCPE